MVVVAASAEAAVVVSGRHSVVPAISAVTVIIVGCHSAVLVNIVVLLVTVFPLISTFVLMLGLLANVTVFLLLGLLARVTPVLALLGTGVLVVEVAPVAVTPRSVLMMGLLSIGTSALGLLAIGMRAMGIAVVIGLVGNGLAVVVAAAAVATAAAVVAIGLLWPIPLALLLGLLASMTFIHLLGALGCSPWFRFGGTHFVGAGLGATTLWWRPITVAPCRFIFSETKLNNLES